MMFSSELQLRRPGLFVTATDTGVGKTVVSCAIAWALREAGSSPARVGVCKPMASGCRHEREGLVSEDAEALAHFADCRQPLDIINPVRFKTPVAPAVASEIENVPIDPQVIAHSLRLLDQSSDYLLVEGVGGLLTPIMTDQPRVTVLDLAAALDYPVAIVCRAGLGTLSHTAMTVRLLKQAGCRVAGLVINGYVADGSKELDTASDISMSSNRVWLERMNKVPILAVVPACPPAQVKPEQGVLPPAILEAVALTYWPDVLMPRRGRERD